MPGERAELLLEQQDRGAVDVAQRLERDLLAALAIERLVDHAHAAHAELADQLEALGSGELARVQQLSGWYAGHGGGFLAAHALPIMHAVRGDVRRRDRDRRRRVISIRGDDDDPFSQGYICPKGTALADLHHDPDRLRQPVVRDGDDAGARSAGTRRSTSSPTRLRDGPHARTASDAVAVYQGNPTAHNLGLLTYGQLLLRTLGTRNCYSATSLDQLPHMLAALPDVRQPAPDAGARHRSHRPVHLPRRATRSRRTAAS